MNASRRGDETEAVLLQRFLDSGLSVSVPFGDSDRYDLVVDEHGELYRMQCKTGNWVNGTVRFNLYTSTVTSNGRMQREYTHEEIDAYAVYSPETATAYWVPVGDTGTGEMRLRVEDPHPKAPASAINWADEYTLSDRFG
ncbi:group I intron-associated PD-(D/E)XK endonuclease [Halostella salina]|uniref:group I intron-associated PD-(D/E)XK endonuclease n=1 Tax=Halostella salina TaxID=1547897 RepID=UPI000EF7F904|nr:group I intron-associated PD-(D/E)XK endonuclease [Halostella salina]